MQSDRTLAQMALVRSLQKPGWRYANAVRRATETATDSAENLAAIKRGNAALREIDAIVRAWVAAHPEGTLR